jgi:hypothetical protein
MNNTFYNVTPRSPLISVDCENPKSYKVFVYGDATHQHSQSIQEVTDKKDQTPL